MELKVVRRLYMYADSKHLSFGIPRFLLTALEPLRTYKLSTRAECLFRPERSLEHAPHQSVSLTDGISAAAQIRYATARRTHRVFFEFIDVLESVLDDALVVEVCQYAELDAASREFLEVVRKYCSKICFLEVDRCPAPSAVLGFTEDEEFAHAAGNSSVLSPHQVSHLSRLAWRRLRAGDPWAAVSVLRAVGDQQQTTSTLHALALAHVALDNTERAEQCYRAWAAMGSPADGARARYGLAMLYARHHPTALRSNSIASEVLEQAYSDLAKAQASNPQLDLTFDEVFNRNGFALMEFRAGRTDEAIRLLEQGAARLDEASERDRMHKSVLLYNVAQIYARSGRNLSAIDRYQRLLKIDPLMPEYHSELALCHAQENNTDAALLELEEAIRLDPYIAESHAIMGYVKSKRQDHNGAATAYGLAWRMHPTPQSAYAYAFYLLKARSHLEALNVLESFELRQVPTSLLSSYASCTAEARICLDALDEAMQVLSDALLLSPESEQLKENIRGCEEIRRASLTR